MLRTARRSSSFVRSKVRLDATAAMELFLVPFCRLFRPLLVPGPLFLFLLGAFAARFGRFAPPLGPSWLPKVEFDDSMGQNIDLGGGGNADAAVT